MIEGFEIVDGRLFIDKELFRQAQMTDNNLSKLTGSCCADMFRKPPKILTGKSSITIDYHDADFVRVPKELYHFIEEIKGDYHQKVRGALKVIVEQDLLDIVINNY